MTKSELIEAIAARGELTKTRAESLVGCVFDSMVDAMRENEGIEIRGFGSFTVRPYKPYDGRNPRTGRSIQIPKKTVATFKPGKAFREAVKNLNGSSPQA